MHKGCELKLTLTTRIAMEDRTMPPNSIKPRKKPVQARSAEMVSAILEAAARILETRGLENYTTNAVAELAGVSIGSLYQYFPGKDALTAELIERETELLLVDLKDINQIPNPMHALDCLIRACVKQQLRRPTLARLLDFEEQRLPLHEQQQSISESVNQTILGILQRLPLNPDENLQTAAADIFAMTRGIIDGAGERGEQDMLDLHRRVRRAVCGYLGL